ncbi:MULTISPECIES: hypothetical protein [Staphylococcus]|uniref:Uncharacterized protein n=6 Tax=Staphylococcus aureus TaxID=1280 RepID=A0AAE8PB69_STAAU|nr:MULTISPECIES: hypothetical protein [Staphylococcus]ETO54955.1 hypothetical protein Y002_08625 [Staphylococcus aureus MUM270]HDH6200317.1 hypothetical protein [Staphylococcus aureus LTCF-15-62]HDH6208948.1 hypothetical protein [Staphylococcus aureus LTCF-14-59]HDH6282482.1 hypothetical protein [Staphylococcus aureus LTCF-3-23]HDH6492307.1 hypothetical protein [Staphylococcus aureus MRSA-Lux-7]HDK8313613.1 hypothetical protein [Staphylococcus aureus subsp. aureus ST22]
MGKEIYLDPIEFQNVLEKFEKGSSEISEVSISSIKDAKNEIILESIVELEKIIDDLSKAMKTYSKMIGSDKEAMDKIASTMQRNDKDNANKIANRN